MVFAIYEMAAIGGHRLALHALESMQKDQLSLGLGRSVYTLSVVYYTSNLLDFSFLSLTSISLIKILLIRGLILEFFGGVVEEFK